MRRLIVLMAVFALLLIAAAPAGATPGKLVHDINCGAEDFLVWGVSVPGFVNRSAPAILFFGGDFTIYEWEGGPSIESWTEVPPPGLEKQDGKLIECEISFSLPSGEYVTIDPALMMFPRP